MKDKSIERRCTFITPRLSVASWRQQVQGREAEQKFAEKVMEILTPPVTKDLPEGWDQLKNVEEAREWIQDRDEESHFLGITQSSSHEIVGFIFLYESFSDHPLFDLRFGYLLSEKSWGKGLGTEIIQGLIQWCKEEGHIQTLSGGVYSDNIASIRVLEKAGFSVSSVDPSSENVLFYEYRFELGSMI